MKKNLKTIAIFCICITVLGLWGNKVMRATQMLFQDLSGIELSEYVRWYSILFMRKMIHFGAFFWLYRTIAKKSSTYYALGVVIFLAFLDEGLQIFIPGRTASWIDIALDTTLPIIFTIVHMSKNKIQQQDIKKPSIA